MDHANTSRPARNLAADFYRVSGVVLIVLGHWLAGAVTYHDGYFGRQNPLVDQPWTQWLTWILQAVPMFFLVAGYAAAVSWTHRHDAEGESRQTWVQHRLARVLGPTTVYVVLVSAVVVALQAYGIKGAVLGFAGWAVAMHLWFLVVYLILMALTPIAIAAHRRWGLWAPGALAVAVLAVDVATLGGHVPYLGWVNYVLCWGTLYQLGIAWHGGLLAGYRPALLAGVSSAALALLIWLGLYPVSMIGVPGQTIDNTTPPNVALLAFGCAQIGIAMAVAPALNRALRAAPVQRVLTVGNNNIMTLYLWHMIPVVIVSIIAYPSGLLPSPAEDSPYWWPVRLEWVVILSAVTAGELMVFWWGRRLFAAPLPLLDIPLTRRWGEPVTLAGAAMAAYGLAYIAAYGFARDGRFSWPTGIIFTAGVLLAALHPARVLARR